MKLNIVSGTSLRSQLLVSYLLNDSVAIDAGALAFHFNSVELLQIQDIILTHVHLDHIASLPFIFSETFNQIKKPLKIYAMERDIAHLRTHIFNDIIWPDFTKMSNSYGQLVTFSPFVHYRSFSANGLKILPVPVTHVVETSGLIVDDGKVCIAFTSDTTVTDVFWKYVNMQERLAALFIDVAFSNEMEDLAQVSKHLTPRLLSQELQKLKRPVDVYAVNLKPVCSEAIKNEVMELDIPYLRIAELDTEYTW